MIKLGSLIVVKKIKRPCDDIYLNVPYRVIEVCKEIGYFTILDSNYDKVVVYFENDPDLDFEEINNFITISNSEFNELMKIKGFKLLDLNVNVSGCIFKVKVNNIIYNVNCLSDKEGTKC